MATERIQTSNYLESFLADIGSSSLKVSSLDAKPVLATHLSRIEQEITSVKVGRSLSPLLASVS
jgi:hypothetical protein